MGSSTDTASGAADAVDSAASGLSRDYLDTITWLRSQNTVEQIAEMIRTHQLDAILDPADLEKAAKAFGASLNAEYVDAANGVADYIADKLEHPVTFDQVNGRALVRMRSNTLDALNTMQGEQRDVIRAVLADGVEQGMNPLETARMLRGSIGLTEAQQDIVANYRAKLVAGDRSALDYALRDRRHDASVTAAADGTRPMTPELIDTMTGRYQKNLLGYRAEVIGRTEGLRVVHQGAHDMWTQAVSDGDVAADAITRKWKHASRGKNSREGHVEMDGDTAGVDEAFTNPQSGATLMYPGDPDADISETAQCRCVVITRMKL